MRVPERAPQERVEGPPPTESEPPPDPAGWDVAPIPADDSAAPPPAPIGSNHRPEYGEAVVRGLLGAKFIGEHAIERPGEPPSAPPNTQPTDLGTV